jgi:two-component system cell cycle response regulator DivK
MNRRRRVLIVNCFPDEREMYEEYLRYAGFDPVEACEPSEAFHTAIAVKPDVIVTDTALPRGTGDGLELIRRLRNDPRTRGIGIVVVSGYAFAQHQRQVEQAGADVFLPKPCLPQTLVAAIEHELRAA